MKNPKYIEINTKGVTDWDKATLLEWLDDLDSDANIEITNNPKKEYIQVKTKNIYYALTVMQYLEENAWDWKDINTQEIIKIPTWIGIEVDSIYGPNYKYCLGINLENGTDFSVLDSSDKKGDWYNPNHTITVKYGENKKVFDDNNEVNL